MNQPINIVVTSLLVLLVLASAAAWQSPDLLERWAVRMMARAMALRFSRQAYDVEYATTLQNWCGFARWCADKNDVEAQLLLNRNGQ